jgi:hypothetical protein
MGPGERVGARPSARLGAGHAVVQALEQPGLEPAGIAGGGEPLQQGGRGCGAGHRRAIAVHVSGAKRHGSEVIHG